jgi:hypothetical protein
MDVNKAWETIRENIKMSAKNSLGYYELKKHKPWFNERCSKLLDHRKQAKLQWLQDPSKINRDSICNYHILYLYSLIECLVYLNIEIL